MEKKVVPVDHWREKQTLETGLIDGHYRVNEWVLDPNKSFRSLCGLIAIFAISIAFYPTLIIIWALPIAIIVAGLIIVYIGAFQGYMQRRYVNGKVFRWWLEESHNQVYKITILVTEWANFVQHGNVVTFHARTLKRFMDEITGEIHCTWIKGEPIAYIENADFMRKGFEEFKKRYKNPHMTGMVREMIYIGQEKKQDRWRT